MSAACPVFDLHCDAVLKAFHKNVHLRDDNAASHVDVPKLRRGGVDGLFLSLWSDPVFAGEGAVKRTRLMLERALAEIELAGGALYPVESAFGLAAAEREGAIAALLGIEGGPSINESLSVLEDFFGRGVRRLTLVCTQSTAWAGSTGDAGWTQGLSAFGRDVVRAMNELGMVVDVAHAGEKTVLDAAKATKKPLFCSHSLARSVVDSPRLATDDMIRAVKDTGGIFGVTFLPDFLAGAESFGRTAEVSRRMNLGGEGATLEEKADFTARLIMDEPAPAGLAKLEGLLPHLDRVIDLIGEDHVGIGSDFDGMAYGPCGLEDASRYDNLRYALDRHGYSGARIAKILGGNVRRVLPQILPK